MKVKDLLKVRESAKKSYPDFLNWTIALEQLPRITAGLPAEYKYFNKEGKLLRDEDYKIIIYLVNKLTDN